ncbi:HAD-IIA family hydrolase [Candidatus Bipolaricaulota bacterium]
MDQSEIKGIIFDVDGVLEFRGQVYPGARETIERLRSKNIVLRFLTNSTLKSRRLCAESLKQKGIHVLDEEVITASYATARYLEELKPRSCWVLLEREGLEEFAALEQDTVNPEYIVVGDCRDGFNFQNMNRALRLLLNGAKLIGMQSELTDTSIGDAELNVGSWVGMLERASGVEVAYVGKPNRYAFELTLRTMGLSRENVVMVGDKVSTDVAGAKNVGLRVALLRTGEFSEQDLEAIESPDYVFGSIADVPLLLGKSLDPV